MCAVVSGSGTAVPNSGSSHGAATPPAIQHIASRTTLAVIRKGALHACLASRVRGAPRNVTPYTFAIHITASAPVMAKPTANSGPRRRAINTSLWPSAKNDW
ncbi:hypothetical protein D3C78_1715560 [compost metagenome]